MSEPFNNFPQPSWGTPPPPPSEMPQWFTPEPYEQAPLQPVQNTPKWRKFVAGVAFMGTIAGGAYAATEVADFNNSEVTASQSYEAVETTEQPAKLELNLSEVESDFELALKEDTCDIKVTAAEATSIYSRLFGGTDLAQLSLEDLTAEADSASQLLEQQKANSELVPIPAQQYAELFEDAWSESPQRDFEEYKSFLSDYAAEFGMTTLFGWEVPQDIYDTELPLKKFIEPLTEQQITHNPNAKRAIVAAVQDLSMMPKSVVVGSGKTRLVFGNILPEGVLGGVTSNADVYIDVESNVVNPDSLGGFSKDDQLVLSHELGHGLEQSMCKLISIFGSSPEDKAYTALNKNYQYGVEGRQQVEGGTYSSLESLTHSDDANGQTGELAVVRDYSHDNESEDKATVLGEHVLNVEKAHEIYAGPEQSSILRKKLTLLITRLAKSNPGVGDYYIALMQTARVQHELEKRQSVQGDITQDILFSPEAAGRTDEALNSNEYQDAKAEADKIGVTLESLRTKIAG